MEGLVVGGRYRILAPLDAGGMGLVYEAEHVETSRRVALKLLLKGAFGGDGAEAASKRFLREARAIGIGWKAELVVAPTYRLGKAVDLGVTSGLATDGMGELGLRCQVRM